MEFSNVEWTYIPQKLIIFSSHTPREKKYLKIEKYLCMCYWKICYVAGNMCNVP